MERENKRTSEQTNKNVSEHALDTMVVGRGNRARVPWFRRLLVPLFLCFLVLAPALAHAQTPHTLIVSLREVSGAGIARATITMRNESGTSDLAQAITDAQGRATFPNLTTDTVRVAVSGSLPDGTPLSQVGQDARGIWLMLDAPLVQLDLRSELNGAVIPDPTTMISADLPILATPRATQSPHTPTRPTAAVGVPTVMPLDAQLSDGSNVRPVDLSRGLVIVGALLLILLLVGWLVQGRRASR